MLTDLAAIAPPAPPRLSITTGWPSTAVMRSAVSRARMSVGPPGPAGTTSLMGRLGEVCALAGTVAGKGRGGGGAERGKKTGLAGGPPPAAATLKAPAPHPANPPLPAS